MSTPPAPPQSELQDRPFSFYPAIHGIDNNEWTLTAATWSEMLVRNTQTDLEVAIPRQFFGAISETDRPVMIVGLTQELEYKTGGVWPLKRKIFSMPTPPLKPPPGFKHEPGANEPTGLAAMMGAGQEGAESRIEKMIGVSLLSLIVVVLAVWAVIRFAPETKPTFVAKDQSYVELNKDDDYFGIVRKLGAPAEDRWKPDSGELQYRALFYKDRGYAVILMGTKQEDARFIGVIGLGPDGKAWSPIYSIEFNRGANTMGMLRALPRF